MAMFRIDMTEKYYKILGDTLSRIKFFEGLSMGDLDQVLERVSMYEFDEGSTVFKQGDPSDALYIVFSGRLSVASKKGIFSKTKSLSELRPGNIFGEMGILAQHKRSATVTALTPCKLYVLLRSDIEHIMINNETFSSHMKRVSDLRKFENRRAA